MAERDFKATWYPRMGEDAAEELRRFQRVGLWLVLLMLVFLLNLWGAALLLRVKRAATPAQSQSDPPTDAFRG
jgi:hypothetical protein